MFEWLEWFLAVINSVFNWLFAAPLYGNVTVGWFMVACLIYALMIRVFIFKP